MMVYLSPMLEYPVPLPKKYQICIENGNFHLEFEYSRGGEGRRRRRELSRHLQFAALIILVSLLLLAAGSLMWRLLQRQKQGRRERRIRYLYICMGGNHFIPCTLYKYQSRRYVIIWYASLTNIKKQGFWEFCLKNWAKMKNAQAHRVVSTTTYTLKAPLSINCH